METSVPLDEASRLALLARGVEIVPVHGRVLGNTGVLDPNYGNKGIAGLIVIGVGHYQIDLLTPMPENLMEVTIVPESSAPRMWGMTPINNGSIEIRVWDAAGVAANMNFRLTIRKVS